MHENTIWLIRWHDRMVEKYGKPDSNEDWCRKLAYTVGEEGNDHPSYHAVAVAKEWEMNGAPFVWMRKRTKKVTHDDHMVPRQIRGILRKLVS